MRALKLFSFFHLLSSFELNHGVRVRPTGSALVSVYDGRNFTCCSSTQLAPFAPCLPCNKIEIYHSECVNMESRADKISSINTHDNCITIWDDRDCTGHYSLLFPGTLGHGDLSELPIDPNKSWKNNVVSISGCPNIYDTGDFTLYEGIFHCCSPECGTCERYQITGSECINLDNITIQISSINTHGTCIKLWENLNCRGRSTLMFPGTLAHENLELLTTGRRVYNWYNNIQSISTCSLPKNQPGSILSPCWDKFLCNDGNCVKESFICDGGYDCRDASDEANCPNTKNSSSVTTCEFQCKNRGCIDLRKKCNFDNDCGDGSDEQNCNTSTTTPEPCTSHLFQCGNGRCIKLEYKCDRDNDCGDGSDESNCPNTTNSTTPETCSYAQFQCYNKNCIKLRYKCDGDNDCGDGSDEVNCPNTTNATMLRSCSDIAFQCNNGRCISMEHKCDGGNHCGDGSDEVNCPPTTTTTVEPCLYNQLLCRNRKCIKQRYKCDGYDDCGDMSDEYFCVTTTPTSSTPVPTTKSVSTARPNLAVKITSVTTSTPLSTTSPSPTKRGILTNKPTSTTRSILSRPTTSTTT